MGFKVWENKLKAQAWKLTCTVSMRVKGWPYEREWWTFKWPPKGVEAEYVGGFSSKFFHADSCRGTQDTSETSASGISSSVLAGLRRSAGTTCRL